jgi:sporulation protein YlmC with PRC-barrel domain
MDELPGRLVIDATGRVLGTIDRLILDTASWAVDSLRLSLRRGPAAELGVPWMLWRRPSLDIPTGLVMAAGEAVLLRATLEDLHGLVDAAPPVGARELAPG